MKIALRFVTALLACLGLVGLAPAPTATAVPFTCNNTADTPLTGSHPRMQVVVEEGASCYVEDAVIHSLRADNPVNVYVLGTTLRHGPGHNINVSGATGSVMVGTVGCGLDPSVGNNVHIRDSHNVLICDMKVDNNISVTGSDGRITVRDSIACDNITVSRNDPYGGPESTHNRVEAIRILRVQAANHVTNEDNSERTVIWREVELNFMSPSGCRRLIRR